MAAPPATQWPPATAPPGGQATPRARRRGRRLAPALGALCLVIAHVPALWVGTPLGDTDPVRRVARPHEFDLLSWEAAQLGARLPALVQTLVHPPAADAPLATPAEIAAVQEFFGAVERWQRAERRGAAPAELEPLRAEWQAARPAAEQAIARAIGVLAVQEGLTTGLGPATLLLPPASFLVTEPPRVLIVSPRDRVEVAQSVLLQPEVELAEVEALETAVDGQGQSALVVTIGGIATYPAIVPLHASPYETLSAIAHEWLHGYLIFHPLGRAYFATYDGRSLNETVAELAGRELGRALAAAYGYPSRRVGGPDPSCEGCAPPQPAAFDFRAEMRATRLQLDALLAAGAVDAAEQYLTERRDAFAAAGYPIRKLNQAYFAFYGSYGDSAAAVSPLNEWVRQLRARTETLGGFLRRVAQMSAPADVLAALEADGL